MHLVYIMTGNHNDPCSDQQIRQSASPDSGVAVVDLAQFGLEGHFSLPPGNYPLRTEMGNCTVDIRVAGKQSIEI